MHPAIFNYFKNENLSPLLIIVKRIGQAGMLIGFIGVATMQFNEGKIEETPFFNMFPNLIGWSFVIGLACLAIVGMYALGKTKNNNTAQAMGRTFLKVFLYMYLPAIIITFVLAMIFLVPRY